MSRALVRLPRNVSEAHAVYALARVDSLPRPPSAPVTCTQDVYLALRDRLEPLTVEQFWCVALDAKNRILGFVLVSQGTISTSLVHPRETFRAAIILGATSVIVAHNHPSGDPEPSPDDEAVTRRLVACGELIGVSVLDHVVVGRGCYVSLRERGVIPG